jgi:hypothetical protein
MAWMWTDDLAARLAAEGLMDEQEADALGRHPVAISVPEELDPVTTADPAR